MIAYSPHNTTTSTTPGVSVGGDYPILNLSGNRPVCNHRVDRLQDGPRHVGEIGRDIARSHFGDRFGGQACQSGRVLMVAPFVAEALTGRIPQNRQLANRIGQPAVETNLLPERSDFGSQSGLLNIRTYTSPSWARPSAGPVSMPSGRKRPWPRRRAGQSDPAIAPSVVVLPLALAFTPRADRCRVCLVDVQIQQVGTLRREGAADGGSDIPGFVDPLASRAH